MQGAHNGTVPEQMLRPSKSYPQFPLAELHAHLGTSISPTVLWQIAHNMGIKLPKTDFKEFSEYITLSVDRRMKLDTYFEKVYHPLLDPLSSGTHAVEQATYQTMGGAYRGNGITLIELRSNPMKHNLSARLDLDHIIMAMIRGMERALLEHSGLSAGLIFCMAREFSVEQNSIILEKAIKYRRRGVVGIDIAGPATASFNLKDYQPLFAKAKKAGLKVTIHSGEVAEATDMWEALEYAAPNRIGHGIRAAYDKPLMKELTKRGVVLEVCPMSNLVTKAVENLDEVRFILRTFVEQKVPFCINTDWPEVIKDCHLRTQIAMLLDHNILSEEEIATCNRTAFAASFIPKVGGLDAYL
jgi:adenosine deaminase